jgi:hypothetical protein
VRALLVAIVVVVGFSIAHDVVSSLAKHPVAQGHDEGHHVHLFPMRTVLATDRGATGDRENPYGNDFFRRWCKEAA